MKTNILFSFLLMTVSCVQGAPICATKTDKTLKAVTVIKKAVGYSMLAVGVPCLLAGIAEAFDKNPENIFHSLFLYSYLLIGIPNTALGALLVIPDSKE